MLCCIACNITGHHSTWEWSTLFRTYVCYFRLLVNNHLLKFLGFFIILIRQPSSFPVEVTKLSEISVQRFCSSARQKFCPIVRGSQIFPLGKLAWLIVCMVWTLGLFKIALGKENWTASCLKADLRFCFRVLCWCGVLPYQKKLRLLAITL